MTVLRLDDLLPSSAPDSLALQVAGGEAWSRGQLRAEQRAWSARFACHPLAAGAMVAIWAVNSPQWVAAALGAWARGLVVVPLSPRWTDHEVRGVLDRTPVALLLGDRARAERAHGLGLGLRVACLDEPPQASCGERPLPASAAVSGEPKAQLGGPERLAALVPTSGTTGAPKLAMLTARGLGATAALTAEALGLGPGDVYWLPMPLAHVGGLGAMCRALGAGAAIALPGPEDPGGALSAWAASGVTHASLVPTQLLDLTTEAPPPWPPSLRVVLVGGAASPPDVGARCAMAWTTYGLTEAGGTVTLGRADAGGSSGGPLPGWEVRVVDPAGAPVPAGEVGELLLRGPGLMAGYWQDAEATGGVLRDGWLHTGDFGALDAAGRVTVHARRTDLIVSGGANVYPAEVEGALLAHPAIREAAVLGEPDPRWGQRVVACVVLRPGVPAPTLEALRAVLAPRLAGYKHPRRVVLVPDLPRLGNGKLDRAALRGHVSEARV
ncbi:MAG: class I adenylate-forming enzyme family protein [Candidatus Sericytochromatia bacterium]|nr:class I adenylate-forming enzyme family protein [Candidatus Sericytochromatia bacterium]